MATSATSPSYQSAPLHDRPGRRRGDRAEVLARAGGGAWTFGLVLLVSPGRARSRAGHPGPSALDCSGAKTKLSIRPQAASALRGRDVQVRPGLAPGSLPAPSGARSGAGRPRDRRWHPADRRAGRSSLDCFSQARATNHKGTAGPPRARCRALGRVPGGKRLERRFSTYSLRR